MTDRVRVLLHHRATETDVDLISAAYREISTDLVGTRGLIANELLRSVDEPGVFVVMSEWESMAAFQEWQSLPDHREFTAALRPFRDFSAPRPFAVYAVTDAY